MKQLDDMKPRDGDENSVRSRIVVQQYNVTNASMFIRARHR